MMCAVAAKRKDPSRSVAILEKNDRLGKKLLSTGNGRCNLTNEKIGAEKYAGSFVMQSKAVFDRYGADRLLKYFEDLGLLTSKDSEGRYYPICRQATAVLDVLRFTLERVGAEVICNAQIRSVKKSGDGFSVRLAEDELYADKLVIACGSKAAPKLGGTSSCADYLKNLGHRFVPFSPALCPVIVNSRVLRSLKGIRAACELTLMNGCKILKKERGEVQFTDDALSGICVFNLSLFAQKGNIISVDLLPDISNDELLNKLNNNRQLFSEKTTDNIFTGILQKRLAQAVLKESGITGFSDLCSNLTDEELKNIAYTANAMCFTVAGKAGFDRAQAALGGAHGSMINENTMQSKACDNLYICGEAVDICGECGGYNLHFAFASGLIAGESI